MLRDTYLTKERGEREKERKRVLGAAAPFNKHVHAHVTVRCAQYK
jgi:hypothetical protein